MELVESSLKDKNISVVDSGYKQHSDKAKQKAVREYMKNGSLALTARTLDISYATIQHWRYRTTWWPELMKRFQEESDRKLASKMEDVVVKAVAQIEDRINNGESILDSKTGQVILVPTKTRDLTSAMKVLSDRTDVLIGRATKDSIAKELMADKLAKLAKEFASFSSARKKEDTSIDLEEVDGVFQVEADEEG